MRKRGNIFVAVDFDGTIVEHKYPDIGKEVPHAITYLKKMRENPKVKLILYTMRDKEELDAAILFCKNLGIEFDYINCNPTFKTQSQKVYAHLYVDDATVCCPKLESINGRPYVDWNRLGPILLEKISLLMDGHYV